MVSVVCGPCCSLTLKTLNRRSGLLKEMKNPWQPLQLVKCNALIAQLIYIKPYYFATTPAN